VEEAIRMALLIIEERVVLLDKLATEVSTLGLSSLREGVRSDRRICGRAWRL